jgi:hypothetical protein
MLAITWRLGASFGAHYRAFRMFWVGLRPPALVRGSDGKNTCTRNQVKANIKAVAMMITATMIASSRLVKSFTAFGRVGLPPLPARSTAEFP